MIAVGVLLLLCTFAPGMLGFVGAFFANLFFGLLGFGAFVLPFIIIGISIAFLYYRQLRFPIGLSIAAFVLVISLLHIVNSPILEDMGFFVRLREIYLLGERFSGGLVGALIGEILTIIIGTVGAIVAIISAILVIAVLLSGRSFVYIVNQCYAGVSGLASRTKEHYANLPDDDDDDFIDDSGEYETDEYETIATIPKAGRARKTPKPSKASTEKQPRLYEMSDRAEYEWAQVKLVHEELGGAIEKRPMPRKSKKTEPDVEHNIEPGTGPLFARRGVDRHDTDDMLFPEKEESREGDHGFYSEEEIEYMQTEAPLVKGLVEDHLTEGFTEEYIQQDEYQQEEYVPARKEPGEPPAARVVNFPAKQESVPNPVIRAREPSGGTVVPPPVHSYDDFELPPITLLSEPPVLKSVSESRTQILENSRILEETLRSFRIEAKVVEVSVGPTVTRYDIAPGPGVKVASIANLSNDLALSLAAQGIRIEAPIPGKSAVGIELPNKEAQPVYLREILQEELFNKFPSRLAFAVGKDIAGEPVVTDIGRMPHLLIAGATGSGKSVCINTLIASLLFKARPDQVKLLMIDPKVVELSVYNGIPHLLIPVVTDPKKASGALSWAVSEMETRYNMFAETGCRDLKGFNVFKAKAGEAELPQIVIIIDELADLMMACKGEVEESICRLAQKARAAGIHLIVATQRPSVDVITGLIKANIPSRLAFAVSSGTDSRTVLDMYGAEKLLGKGDMLFLPMGNNKPVRIQGGFISDNEVENLVSFLKAQAPMEYTTEMIQQVTMPGKANIEGPVDEFFHDAVDFLLTKGKASTSMLQRQFRIGYNRASRLMDELQTRGIVGPEDGVKPRKVTITRDEYHELYGQK